MKLLKKIWAAIVQWLKECREIGNQSTYQDVDSHLGRTGQGLPENQKETEGAKRLREAQEELARMRANKKKGTKQ